MPRYNQISPHPYGGHSNYAPEPKPNPWVFKKSQLLDEEKRRTEKAAEAERAWKRKILCCWCYLCCGCCWCCCNSREEEQEEERPPEPEFNAIRYEALHNCYTGDEMYKEIDEGNLDVYLAHMLYDFLRTLTGHSRFDVSSLQGFLASASTEIQTHKLLGYNELAVTGAALPGVFFISTGEVVLTVNDPRIRKLHQKQIRLHRGQYFGDAEFVLKQPSQFDVHTYKKCILHVVPSSVLNSLLAQLPYSRPTYDPTQWYTKRHYPFAPDIKDEPSTIKGRIRSYRNVSPAPKEEYEAGLEILAGKVVEFHTALLMTRWFVERTGPVTKTVDETPALYTRYQEQLFISVLQQTDLFGHWGEAHLKQLLTMLPEEPFMEFAEGDSISTHADNYEVTHVIYQGRVKAVLGKGIVTGLPGTILPTVLNEENIFEPTSTRIVGFTAASPCYTIALPTSILREPWPKNSMFTKQETQWSDKISRSMAYLNSSYVQLLQSEITQMSLKLSTSYRLMLPKHVQELCRTAEVYLIKKDHYLNVDFVSKSYLMLLDGELHHVRLKQLREYSKWTPFQIFTAMCIIERQAVYDVDEFILYAAKDTFCLFLKDPE